MKGLVDQPYYTLTKWHRLYVCKEAVALTTQKLLLLLSLNRAIAPKNGHL